MPYKHSNLYCLAKDIIVSPEGNICEHCGARLIPMSVDEAIAIKVRLEAVAEDRVDADTLFDHLTPDEQEVYEAIQDTLSED